MLRLIRDRQKRKYLYQLHILFVHIFISFSAFACHIPRTSLHLYIKTEALIFEYYVKPVVTMITQAKGQLRINAGAAPLSMINRKSLSVVVIVMMMVMVMTIVAMIIVVISFSGTIQTDHAKQSERCVLQNFHLFLSPR